MTKRGRLRFEHGKWQPSYEEASQPALIERDTQRREGDAFWAGVLAGAGISGLLSVVIYGVAILL
jgi:hypothetical protein